MFIMVVEEKKVRTILNMYEVSSDEFGCNVESYELKYIGFGLCTRIATMGCIAKSLMLPHLEEALFHRLYYTGTPLYHENKVRVYG